MGFFALPILYCISWTMSLTFKKRVSQILYFVVVTVLLFNNTQIGNPLLLVVLAINISFSVDDISNSSTDDKEKYRVAS